MKFELSERLLGKRRVKAEGRRERAWRLSRPEHIQEFSKKVLGTTLFGCQMAWHDLLVEHPKLLLECQVGSGKSHWVFVEIVQHILRERLKGRVPRILFGTSSSRLARDYGFRVRTALGSRAVRELYGAVRPKDPRESWADLEFRVRGQDPNVKEPCWRASGVGGAIEGSRGTLGVLDDFIDLKNALSPADRESTDFWLRSTFLARLDPGSPVLAIGSSWHVDDAYVRIARMTGWHHEKFPALREDPPYQWGEVLCPEKWGEESLEEKRLELGSTYFKLRYLMDHEAMTGRFFKPSWLEWVDKLPEGLRFFGGVDLAVTSASAAAKERSDPDYSVVAVVGQHPSEPGYYYLVDIKRERISHGHEEWIEEAYDRHMMEWLAVEENSFQKLIGDRLRATTSVNAIGHKAATDKVTRILGLQGPIESGKLRVWKGLPDSAVQAFLSELVEFPHGRHDDVLDALQMVIGKLGKGPSSLLLEGDPMGTDGPSRGMSPYPQGIPPMNQLPYGWNP